MGLFQLGNFTLHSGARSRWKIECDALGSDDWECLAVMLTERLPPFREVEGVPRGGLPLAEQVAPYATGDPDHPLLIVDDVWTTGDSMVVHRNGREAIGGVIFARGPLASWVTAVFPMPPKRRAPA